MMTAPGSVFRRALLLDRDGVINRDHGYICRREDMTFCDGIFDLVRRAADCGYLVVVVTNQSGIGRGFYSEEKFHTLTAWMLAEFAKRDAALAGVFYCPYWQEAKDVRYARDSYWRKPNPGMIRDAAQQLRLNLENSIFLGDQETDMAAARAAGVGTRVFLGTTAPSCGADLVIGQLRDLTVSNWLKA